MNKFSEKTLKSLFEAGWTPERETDISIEIGLLEQAKYSVFPVVKDFLKHFGGLRLSVPNPLATEIISFLDLTVERAIRSGFDREMIQGYGEDLGIEVCPIGVDRDSIVYIMSSAGYVYGIYSADTWLIGNSGEQAIDNWCNWHPQLAPFPIVYTIPDE